MTTWLRVEVGAREENKSLATCHNHHFYLNHFLTNQILVIGILATGCRLIASSSIHSILYLPMVECCPVVTNSVLLPMTSYKPCPVAHDKNCLPPNNHVLLQVYYLFLFVQYHALQHSTCTLVFYLFSNVCVYRYQGLINLVLLHILCWVANPTCGVLYHYQYLSTSIMYDVLLQTITK